MVFHPQCLLSTISRPLASPPTTLSDQWSLARQLRFHHRYWPVTTLSLTANSSTVFHLPYYVTLHLCPLFPWNLYSTWDLFSFSLFINISFDLANKVQHSADGGFNRAAEYRKYSPQTKPFVGGKSISPTFLLNKQVWITSPSTDTSTVRPSSKDPQGLEKPILKPEILTWKAKDFSNSRSHWTQFRMR